MGFKSKLFTAIVSCLTSIAVQSFGELLVLRHPINDELSTQKLICFSENDDAAVIWNNNPDIVLNSSTDFYPSRSTPKNISECAIWWNSGLCHTRWETIRGWEVVKSTVRPMGPVLDFRWEDFTEFTSETHIYDSEYQYVGEVKRSSGSVAFSARGQTDLHIFLCENKNLTMGSYFWIIIGGWEGTKSVIWFCEQGKLGRKASPMGDSCVEIDRNEHRVRGTLDPNEWRTFILTWASDEKTIQVIRDTDHSEDPILQGHVDRWPDVSHMSVKLDKTSRVRFHIYDYLLTEDEDSVLYTEEFYHYGEHFCVDLLIGLCPECKLNLRWVDESGRSLEVGDISGQTTSEYNGMLVWRSVKLNKRLKNDGQKSQRPMKLEIRTSLTGGKRGGQWAIDNFRICEPVGQLRYSTKSFFTNEPEVRCQKLSYGGNAVVDPRSTNRINSISSESRQLIDKLVTSRVLPFKSFGKNSVLCDSTGCTCSRGFTGSDCNKTCPGDYYGYNCNEECGTCDIGFCDKITGFCANGCESKAQITPLCKAIPAPPPVKDLEIYEADLEANTISLRWIPPHPAYGVIESYNVSIVHRSKLISSRAFKVSDKKLRCQSVAKYVCLKDFTIPPNITKDNNYEIQVRVTNEDVSIAGAANIVPITFKIYKKEPSEPETVTPIFQGHGIMMLKWARSVFTPTKITKFHIYTQSIDTYLSGVQINKTLMMVEHPVQSSQTEYSVLLFLYPSTFYIVEIVAVNQLNFTSKAFEMWIQVPNSVGFASGEKLQATQNGTFIYVKIPAIVNATMWTTIHITVKGLVLCTQNASSTVSSPKNLTEWAAAEYKVQQDENNTKNLTIGAGYNHGVPLNCSLYMGETYVIELVVIDRDFETSTNLEAASITMVIEDDQSRNLNLVWFASPPIQAICLVLLFIGYRNRKRIWRLLREPSYVEPDSLSSTILTLREVGPVTYLEVLPESLPATGTNNLTDSERPETSITQPEIVENKSSALVYAVPKEPDSCTVMVGYFQSYVKKATSSGLLYSQFMNMYVRRGCSSQVKALVEEHEPKKDTIFHPLAHFISIFCIFKLFRRGLTKPCEYGGLPENMPKNRCKYSIAYDHSRVVLQKILDDPYSDYINASWIKGCEKERAYIATQGPKPNTLNDFWRMVWQEKVQVICMLTNDIEDAETKCEKYWPDVGTGVKHGEFHISNIEDEMFAYYTLRIFELSYEQDTRKVRHLHYTGWPSLGVPTYPHSLIAYLKRLKQTPPGNGPVLVHCSTGDDRTGTIILCDICLRQAVTKKEIDVTAVTTRMRDSRANMVGTLQQYLLAHIIISEIIVSRPTQIPCTDVLSTRMKQLRKHLPHDIQRLNDSTWQMRVLESSAAKSSPTAEELANNKVYDFILDRPEVMYDDVFPQESNQLNPVSVDSLRVKNQYLACQLPLPSTLSSLWKIVAERNVRLIIILQCSDPEDPTCSDIMPDKSTVVPELNIQVKPKTNSDEAKYFTNENLLLTDTSKKYARSQSVTVLTCKGWGSGRNKKPPPPATLISVWKASEKIVRKEGETLVLCHDGITACGLYLALSFLLERMVVENECDVISAVRAVRRSGLEFVRLLAQFDYLYDAAVNFEKMEW